MDIDDLRQKAAEYNPRKITKNQLAGLKKSLIEFGNLSDIVYNRRTGNLVTFHQRVKCMPKSAEIIVEKTYEPPTETGTVAEGYMRVNGERFGYREVDWDLHKEKKANIIANNAGGDFDQDLLSYVLKDILDQEPNIDPHMFGFGQSDLDKLLEKGEGQAGDTLQDIKKIFEVVIECASEQEQEQIFNRLTREGYKCRTLTL